MAPLVEQIQLYKQELASLRAQQATAVEMLDSMRTSFGSLMDMAYHHSLMTSALDLKVTQGMTVIEKHFDNLSEKVQDAMQDLETLRAKVMVTKSDTCCRYHLSGGCTRGDACDFLHLDPLPPAAPASKGKGKSKGKSKGKQQEAREAHRQEERSSPGSLFGPGRSSKTPMSPATPATSSTSTAPVSPARKSLFLTLPPLLPSFNYDMPTENAEVVPLLPSFNYDMPTEEKTAEVVPESGDGDASMRTASDGSDSDDPYQEYLDARAAFTEPFRSETPEKLAQNEEDLEETETGRTIRELGTQLENLETEIDELDSDSDVEEPPSPGAALRSPPST